MRSFGVKVNCCLKLKDFCIANTEVLLRHIFCVTVVTKVALCLSLFPCNVQPRYSGILRRFPCLVGKFDFFFGVYFGQVFFEDNRNECRFLPHLPLSRLRYCNRGGPNDGDPSHHSGSSADHSGGLWVDDPEGYRNEFSQSGSDSLEWHGGRDDSGRRQHIVGHGWTEQPGNSEYC